MPTVKIENKSEDDIIVTLDSEEKELADGESIFFENKEKGCHSVKIHRRRVPRETVASGEAPKGLEAAKEQDKKPGSHVQLDSVIEFDVNSSKAAVTVIQDIKGVETLHEDVIFAGYTAELAGAKLISKTDSFANSRIKKNYIFQQIKDAFIPVGIAGIAILILGAFFSLANLVGFTVKFGSSAVSLRRSLLLFAGGVLVTGFFCVNVYKILKRAKSLSPKENNSLKK